jgi:thymidine phosphorylase
MAQGLAHSIVAVASGAGLKTTALITDMNQVLGRSVGNAIEVGEAIAYLRGDAPLNKREPRQHEITLALGAELLVLGGLARDTTVARLKLQTALDSGAAAEHFARMVAALGGPVDLMERPDAYLVDAPVVVPVPALRAGLLSAMRTRDIGMAVVELGGGRRKASDAIDTRVGLTQVQPLGARLQAGEPIAFVHAADSTSAQRAVIQLQTAFTLSDDTCDVQPWQATPTVLSTCSG